MDGLFSATYLPAYANADAIRSHNKQVSDELSRTQFISTDPINTDGEPK